MRPINCGTGRAWASVRRNTLPAAPSSPACGSCSRPARKQCCRKESRLFDLHGMGAALEAGGAMIYPLAALALLAAVIILEKGFVFAFRTRLPEASLERHEKAPGGRSYFA